MMNYQSFTSLNDIKNCVNGFTYRNGGVASLPFGNQHMGLLSFHHQEAAWHNIVHLIKQVAPCGDLKAVVATEQIHQDHLEHFQLETATGVQKDGYNLHVLKGTDGVFTMDKQVLLLTFYADCTPVYFVDANKGAIGMVHSGWKGTALNIATKGLRFMQETFGSQLTDISVVIGPSASVCCYEVDEVVFSHFPEHAHCFKSTTPGHYLMDMKRIISENLMQAGLTSDQIEISSNCTLCQPTLYFSHRGESGNTGRMAAFLMLHDSNV